jgi:predicted DNA binding CopG/RHH family protein
MKTRDFDKIFDGGGDVTRHLDLAKARRPGHEQKRVNVDFPLWMVESLDREASRLGVPRQSLIKMLIARHLQNARPS